MKEKTSKAMDRFNVAVGIATIISCIFTVCTVFQTAEDIKIMVQQNTELCNDIENKINNEVKILLKQEVKTVIDNYLTQDKSGGGLQQTANPPQEVSPSVKEEKNIAKEIKDIKGRHDSVFHNK